MARLQGKVALITGGTSGIGLATAKLFHAEGARVIATGSSAASVNAAHERLPRIDFVHSDAGDVVATHALVERVRDAHGRLDVLFVNAGIARLAALDASDEALFDKVFDVNFRGPYFLIRHAAPILAEGASVILTSSLAAIRGFAGLSVYGASKAALGSLGLSLSIELAPRKIRVNTIIPGPIATELGSKMELDPAQAAHPIDFMDKVLLSRVGQPDEIAAAALYFASDDSRFTTGTALTIDGGYAVS